ncbi:MAG: FTR1 family protein [Candidatus Gracilibacteria bacterium]|jgi:high-affinity iron transporter
MFTAFITSLRETFEASIIVSIILAYLSGTHAAKQKVYIWIGVAMGVVVSFLLAYFFSIYFGGLEGKKEALFEGVTSLLAAGFIVWMIIWMIYRSKNLRKHIQDQTKAVIDDGYLFGLTTLAFISVAREGIEVVLFLQPLIFETEQYKIAGGVLSGALVACVIAYLFYKGILKFSLKLFFDVTTVFLAIFAMWLMFTGLHEISELMEL